MDLQEIREIEAALEDGLEVLASPEVYIKQWDTARNLAPGNFNDVYEEVKTAYYADPIQLHGYVSVMMEAEQYDDPGSGVTKPVNVKVLVTERELRRVGLIVDDVPTLTERDVVEYKGETFDIVHVERKARLTDQTLIVIIWGFDARRAD